MKKKTMYLIFGIIILIIVLGITFLLLRGLNGGEDNWIKDSKGVWVRHGNPANTPSYVAEQQDAVTCALDLYSQAKSNGISFNSQCLGACANYSVDIVHSPRTIEDDKASNQCSDYPKKTPYFIEIDNSGNIVRVA
jgi:hypothetical protein